MPKHRDDWNELLNQLREQGWTVQQRRKHYQLLGPDGQILHMPVSSSDWRALRNARSQLRRAGADL